MKEFVASILITMSRFQVLNFVIKLIYRRGISVLINRISRQDYKAIYLKNNIDSEFFMPGVSDLDFLVITPNEEGIKKIEFAFKKVGRLYPFIKDVDIILLDDVQVILEYGKNKYRNFQNWKKLKGDYEIQVDYIYYPLKFFIEQTHELFFLLEWLDCNFQKYQMRKSRYRKEALKRTLIKLFNTLGWIEKPEDFVAKKVLKPGRGDLNKIIDNVFRYDSLENVSKYLNKCDFLTQYSDCLPIEYEWFEENVERDNNKIKIGDNFYIEITSDSNSKKRLNFSEAIYKLFLKTGSLHFDVLNNAVINSKNELNRNIIDLYCYTIFLEGNRSNVTQFNKHKMNLLSNALRNGLKTKLEKPYSFLGKTIYITSNWGTNESRERSFFIAAEKMKSQNIDINWFHFDLCSKSEGARNYPENVVPIVFHDEKENMDLWQKEALFNIGAEYCFGAKNFIFADADIYSEHNDWIEDIEAKLNTCRYDFVHGFSTVKDTVDPNYNADSWTKKFLEGSKHFQAPGLIWGVPRSLLKIFRYLPDIFPDGSNDGAFLEELTAVEMGITSQFEWYRSRIRHFRREFRITYIDKDVIHVNHGEARDYVNRGTFLNMLALNFEDLFAKNAFGVYEWGGEPKCRQAINISKKSIKLTPDELIDYIDDLVDNKIFKVPNKMQYWNDQSCTEVLIVKNGIAILNKNKSGNFEVRTSRHNLNAKIELIFDHYRLYDNEHLYVEYNVHKPIKTNFNVEVYYNWWKMIGSENLFPTKYFTNTNEQPLALCMSSWDNNIEIFTQITGENLKGQNKFTIEKRNEDFISLYHGWLELQKRELSYKEVDYNDEYYVCRLPLTLNAGWHKVELLFEGLEDIPVELLVCTEDDLKGVTSMRIYNNKEGVIMKTCFLNKLNFKPLVVKIKFRSERKLTFNKLKLELYERARI